MIFSAPVALILSSKEYQSQWSLSTKPLSMARLLLAPRNAIQPLADPVTNGLIFLIQVVPCALGGAITILPSNSSFFVSRVIKVVGGRSIIGRKTFVIFSTAPCVYIFPISVSRYFKRRCAFPKVYPNKTEVLPSALFSAHQLLISVKTSACGVHLKAGNPKVFSVINVWHFTTSYGTAIPSSSVL